MKLQILKSIRSDQITVVASLPDMGRVGGLVSAFLSQSLNAEQVAEIASSDKPWVTYADGVVSSANEVYRIFYDDRRRLLILTGESQPQDPGELYRLCNTFLDYAQSVGTVRRLYGAGGYLRENIVGAPRVCGVVNRPELKAVLAKAGIEPVGSEITTITWFNGIVLSQAADRKIEGIGLFGEISESNVPQPLAAKSILAALSRLEKLELDTRPLDRQYESILEEAQRKKEPSHYGPGIG
ncbi:MAG TPA: PAC2 family protein [Nitrososphaera sp.]|jgi:proteasome assembly chaperone (PAC2) family protein|nr:PAC2 family protein [Nitrososphaera sp.]